MDTQVMPSWPDAVSAVVLAGGRSTRLGRDKLAAHVGGEQLLHRVVAGIPTEVPLVVVGPDPGELPARVRLIREQPPGGGPLAGLAAGLALMEADLVVVLAGDMPFAVATAARAAGVLVDATGADAVVPVAGGHRQPLCAAYRVGPLRQALAGLGALSGLPVRRLLDVLQVMELPVLVGEVADVDTADDLAAARRRAKQEAGQMQDWIDAVREALGVNIDMDIDVVLDVARDAAHAVARPAAPLTAYLLGAAIANGADARAAAAKVAALASGWDQAQQ